MELLACVSLGEFLFASVLAILRTFAVWGMSVGAIMAFGVASVAGKVRHLLWAPVFALLVIVVTAIACGVLSSVV